MYSSDRLTGPRLKSGDTWENVSWEEALDRLTTEIKEAEADKVGVLASPSSTLEEFHLLSLLAENVGTANIDHRTRQRDFSDQTADPLMPWLGGNIADIENADAILVVGSNLRKEVPIIGHRVRKAAVGGAAVSFINTEAYEYFFGTHEHIFEAGLVTELAGVANVTLRMRPLSASAM